MKKERILKLLLLLLIAMTLFVAAMFLVDYFTTDKTLADTLPRTLATLAVCMVAVIRVARAIPKSKPLSFYEKRYAEQIGDAFLQAPAARKKLLTAIRAYNQNNYFVAIRLLNALSLKCKSPSDKYATQLFLGLTYTDMELPFDAIESYLPLCEESIATSTIFNNLGMLQADLGEYEKAISNFEHSLELDPKNATTYSNLASVQFRSGNLEEAIPFAEQALSCNQKHRQAASLLAIIYALLERKEECEKYFHIAVSAGQSPDALKESIRRFREKPTWSE